MTPNNILPFNFVKKTHRHLGTILIYKLTLYFMKKTNLKESLHILEDGASGCASGHIGQVIVMILLKK